MDTERNIKNPSWAFFGAGKGHALKPRRAALFDSLLPRVVLDLSKPAPPNLASLFSTTVTQVRLEIGFGGAEHLLAQAVAEPGTGFIGADAFVNAIAKALAGIETHKLANVRLYFGDVSELIDRLPGKYVSRS